MMTNTIRRPEPRGMTSVDLVALVAGIAFALALCRCNEVSILWMRHRIFSTSLYQDARFYAHESARIVCLALVPVILTRRFRFGGTARPAEFLAACHGWALVAMAIQSIHVLGLDSSWRKSSNHSVYERSHSLWVTVHFASGLLTIAILWISRRRLPGWAASILLLIAWAGLTTSFESFTLDSLRWLTPEIRPSIRMTLAGLLRLPARTLYWLPLVVACMQLFGHTRRHWTWVEWCGLACAAVSLARLPVAYLIILLSPPDEMSLPLPYGNPPIWVSYAFQTAWFVAACLIDVIVVYFLGPAWNCLFGLGYDRRSSGLTPPEAHIAWPPPQVPGASSSAPRTMDGA